MNPKPMTSPRFDGIIPGDQAQTLRQATIRLLVGDLHAGIDALLNETRFTRRAGPADGAFRLGEATVQLSLAELATAGEQLRAALDALEFSNKALDRHSTRNQPTGSPVSAPTLSGCQTSAGTNHRQTSLINIRHSCSCA